MRREPPPPPPVDKRDSAARTEQANSVRLIYSLAKRKPVARLNCKLRNGFYFVKVSRSDERLRFTENDISAIVRTILFMYVFRVSPRESMLQLINRGCMRSFDDEDMCANPQTLSVDIARRVLDALLGDNFSMIARRAVRVTVKEYMDTWRYYNTGIQVKCPSADDFIKIYRFVNVVSPTYSAPTLFVNTNLRDHKIRLQSAVKSLT